MGNKLKFLLVNPTASSWQVERGAVPRRRTRVFRYSMLPSLYVAASMPPYVETQIIDEDIEAVNFDTDADLIGISFMTFNAPRAYEIADKFRQEKGKPVIFGGYHPTFMREEAIEHADSICIGESENNVPRMMEDFTAGRLQPFYESGRVDLKGLPVPDRSLIRRSAYVTPDTVQATRGCPNRCKFCSVTQFFHHEFRMRPVDEVVDELENLGRYLIFMDDNILGNPAYARELFAKMIPLRKKWFSQCSIRIAYDDELRRLAAESGCRGLFIGFESISQDNLSDWNKGFNWASDYVRAIAKVHSAGIGVIGAIVFGNDWDTLDTFEKTLDFLSEAKVDALQATVLTPFPGTPLFEEMNNQGRIIDRNWSRYDFGHAVFEPKNMSPEMLTNGVAWVLRKYYSRTSVLQRLWRGFGYMSPWTVLRVSAPINFGYRSRLRKNGTFDKGRYFIEPNMNGSSHAQTGPGS